MRYALRKQDKIAAAIGDDYLKNHILKSLDSFIVLSFHSAQKGQF